MSGIVINIDPVIFHAGGFALRWYSLFIVVAIAAAIFVAVKEAQRRGIAKEHVYSLTLWGLPAGFLGARLFHVVDKSEYYLSNPIAILSIQQGGLAIWGGIAGGAIAGVFYAKSKGLPIASLADVATLALLSGQIIGRLGCIVNGDAYGGATDLPWGFIYTHPDALIPQSLWGIPTHPYPVYEMFWNLSMLALLWGLRKRMQIDGLIFFGYVLLYSLGRFFLTFFRQEEIWFWGLQEAQVVALLVLSLSLLFLVITGTMGRAMRKRILVR